MKKKKEDEAAKPTPTKDKKTKIKEVEAKKSVLKTILWVIMLCAWVFVAVVGSEFLVSLLLYWVLPEGGKITPVLNSIFSAIAYLIAIMLIIWLPPKIFKKKFKMISRERVGLKSLPTWTDIGLMFVGYIVSLIISGLLTMLFQLFPWFNSGEAQELGYNIYMSGGERALAFIALAIVAPIAEEIIFRGWLYGKLRVKIPKFVAILIVSLLFGLVHMQWNVGITVFALSVVNCLLREVTGNIYAGTLVHMLNNGVAFFLVYMLGMA